MSRPKPTARIGAAGRRSDLVISTARGFGAILFASCATAIPSATSSFYVALPTLTTTYSYKVTDSANTPDSQCSPGDTVGVNPVLVANAITPSASTINDGQSITLAAHASGGTLPYSYHWYQSTSLTCPSGNPLPTTTSTISVSPSSNAYYCYTATDSSLGTPLTTATSAANTVTVDPPLILSAPSVGSHCGKQSKASSNVIFRMITF